MGGGVRRIQARVARLETVERVRDGGEVGRISLHCAAATAIELAVAGFTGAEVEIEIRVAPRRTP